MTAPVFPILPTTQKYDWGKIGLNSKVAQFANAAQAPGFALDEKAPYAELWMGTHHTSPSRLLQSGEVLSKHLSANLSLLGDEVIQTFDAANGDIPFLFKVLAIEKALSIQTHPDKKMAERLHAELPNIYKDPNHKPEMAIALTPFTALCSFQPLPQIAGYLRATPEFAALIQPTIREKFLSSASSSNPNGLEEKAALRDLFSALMTEEESVFQPELEKLVKRYEAGQETVDERDVKELVLRLNSQFPGDIGVFCAFLLNYVRMQPGDAIFLGAGEPHAYVSGDIVECMATSDNVIRAGLTPKLRDIPNLIAGLTYTSADPSKHIVRPRPFGVGDASALYDPPVPEFSVLRTRLPARGRETQAPVQGPSIFIVTEGSGRVRWEGEGGEEGLDLGVGRVVFVGANTPVTFEATEGLEVHRAFVQPKDL